MRHQKRCVVIRKQLALSEVVDYYVDVGAVKPLILRLPRESLVGMSFIVYFWPFMLAVHFKATSFCFYLNLISNILKMLAESLA
jgi:hypothetical protein